MSASVLWVCCVAHVVISAATNILSLILATAAAATTPSLHVYTSTNQIKYTPQFIYRYVSKCENIIVTLLFLSDIYMNIATHVESRYNIEISSI